MPRRHREAPGRSRPETPECQLHEARHLRSTVVRLSWGSGERTTIEGGTGDVNALDMKGLSQREGSVLSYMLAVGEELPEADLLEQARRVVDEDYRLGRVAKVAPIPGGLINFNAVVTTEMPGGERTSFFLRKYNGATTVSDVAYEHRLIAHLVSHGFDRTTEPYRARDGSTFVTRTELVGSAEARRIFAVFRYLEGEDTYSWLNNRMTREGFASAATLLAQFHHFGVGFDGCGLERTPAGILEVLSLLPAALREYGSRADESAFDRVFLTGVEAIRAAVARSRAACDALSDLPVVTVHGDFSPGNVKFRREEAMFVFDFDYAKRDVRIFDIGLALGMFCSLWEGRDAGRMHLDDVRLMVAAYQDEAARYLEPGPLSGSELALLPTMIAAGNLYVILWTLNSYYSGTDYDAEEWAAYLQHMLDLMDYLEAHQNAILEACMSELRRAPR
jgi:homoserine kinase type II